MKTNNLFIPLIWVLVASSLHFCTAAAEATVNADKEPTVVVIGDCGHGTSTVIASLLTEMKVHGDEWDSVFKPKNKNVKGEWPEISLSLGKRTTTTFAPYALKNSKVEYVKKEIGDITLVNTRGFGCDWHEEDDIDLIKKKAIIELNHIFKTRTIKGIVLVVRSLVLSAGSGKGIHCLYQIADFFLNQDVIAKHVSQSLAVVIAHSDKDKVEQCYNGFGAFIKNVSHSPDNETTNHQKALVRVLQNKGTKAEDLKSNKDYKESINKKKVLTFHPLDKKSIKALVDAIKKFKGIPLTACNEEVQKTPESRDEINQLINEVDRELLEAIKKKEQEDEQNKLTSTEESTNSDKQDTNKERTTVIQNEEDDEFDEQDTNLEIDSTKTDEDEKTTTTEWLRLCFKNRKRDIVVGSLVFFLFVIAHYYDKISLCKFMGSSIKRHFVTKPTK